MYRLLIIEDDANLRQLLSKTLAAEGFECLSRPDGASGLKACESEKPDLLILDVNLPDGDGIELCKRLKVSPALRHIPVLIMTGEAVQVECRMGALESGADDYILKPFSPKELAVRARAVLKVSAPPTRDPLK